eukprot:9636540-Lingulodinium_polyedra.AAC.1
MDASGPRQHDDPHQHNVIPKHIAHQTCLQLSAHALAQQIGQLLALDGNVGNWLDGTGRRDLAF